MLINIAKQELLSYEKVDMNYKSNSTLCELFKLTRLTRVVQHTEN